MMSKKPKGKLLVIGGGEAREVYDNEISDNRDFKKYEILEEIIPEKGKKKTIEIITTASSVPDEIEKMYKKAFSKAGYSKINFMYIGNNMDAKKEAFIKRIKESYAVFFSGGDQFRLSTILGSSDVLGAILEKYFNDKDFLVAGTSAGAMALSEIMMIEGEKNEAILNKTLRLSSGLGFIHNCIFDTHFVKRGRFGRLTQAVVMNPTCLGIGVGEDTALLIKDGNHAECKGAGMIIIIDGKEIGHTNIAYAEEDEALCIENLRVHILSNGNGFLLGERQFVPSKKDLRRELEIVKKTTHKQPGKKKTPKKK
jgi:cyanophycinase